MKPGGFVNREKENREKEIIQVKQASSSITEDQVNAIVADRVEKALNRNQNVQNVQNVKGEEDIGMSDKLIKQLQSTVGVFNALKEFSSNPLQKAIENKVGMLAADVIDNAFSRPSSKPKGVVAEFLSPILDSQFGAQLGVSLGQRAPELVESLGKTFGKERAANMVDGVLGAYGKKQIGGGIGGGGLREIGKEGDSETKQVQPSDKELLLTLDPNNPEHVAAYAESQGKISIDVARKMLIVHQDDFIKQMQNQGMDVSKYARGQQGQQGQIMEVLQQFSGDMNKALGNTNTIINKLYKKIEGLENEVNILKGGKGIKIEGEEKEVIEEMSKDEKMEIKEGDVNDDKVNDNADRWSDENMQEAVFGMRT